MEEVVTVAGQIRDAIQAAYVALPDAPAHYMLQPGSEVDYAQDVDGVDDLCCSGAVIVLTGRKRFEDLANLRAGSFWQPYAVVVLRCAPTVSDTGLMPKQAANEAAVELYNDDMKVVRDAVRTFLDEVLDVNEPDVLAWYEDQISPSGGCGGCIVAFDLLIAENC